MRSRIDRDARVLAVVVLSVACTAETSRPPLPVPAQPSAIVKTADASTTASSAPVADADTATPVDNVVLLNRDETKALLTSEGKASRINGELRIRLLNGKTLSYRDDTTTHYVLPRYETYLKAIHAHVVHAVPMEGTGAYVMLDDSTGDSTVVYGVPVPSADGKRFAVTSMVDAGAGYDRGLIEVWRMVGRKPEKEFEYSTEDSPWQPTNAVWKDSTTIQFTKNVFTSFTTPYAQTRARLIRLGNTWIFADSLSRPQ